jgi:hypothetical protein
LMMLASGRASFCLPSFIGLDMGGSRLSLGNRQHVPAVEESVPRIHLQEIAFDARSSSAKQFESARPSARGRRFTIFRTRRRERACSRPSSAFPLRPSPCRIAKHECGYPASPHTAPGGDTSPSYPPLKIFRAMTLAAAK